MAVLYYAKFSGELQIYKPFLFDFPVFCFFVNLWFAHFADSTDRFLHRGRL